MKHLKIALDWTPNANHVGFYVAQELGYYKDLNIAIEIIDTSVDNYAITPAKKVELGLVDLALCPLESVMSYRSKETFFPMIAIATFFQEDLSAIVTTKDSSISSPKELSGKTYASYKARYEDAIVKQMIINDGGDSSLDVIYPEKLGIWDTIVNGTIDATWIFTNWEGVQASQNGLELNYFKLKDYGIPYSYSPVIVTDESKLEAHKASLKRFLEATKKGWYYAQQHPEKAVAILQPLVPQKDQDIDLLVSIKETCAVLGDATNWGTLNHTKVEEFLTWLQDHELENHQLKAGDLFTNQFLS